MGYGLAPALKASMEIIGLSLGKPYPPFKAVEGADLEAMRTLFKNNLPFRRDPSERDPKACRLAPNRSDNNCSSVSVFAACANEIRKVLENKNGDRETPI